MLNDAEEMLDESEFFLDEVDEIQNMRSELFTEEPRREPDHPLRLRYLFENRIHNVPIDIDSLCVYVQVDGIKSIPRIF